MSRIGTVVRASGLGLAAALILLVVAPATFGAATTLYVNGTTGSDGNPCTKTSPCQTIAHAVSAASAGDTVQVAAGTYAENVTIAKELTLKGAQAGVDARTRSGSESIVSSVSVSSSGVTVDGFSFDGAGSQAKVEAPGSSVLSGVVIDNDVFGGYGTVGLTTYDAGDIVIQRNLFGAPAGSGEAIQLRASAVQGGCDGSQALDNLFAGATTNEGADVNFSCTGSNSEDVTVSRNVTEGDGSEASFTAFSGIDGGIAVTLNKGSTGGSSIFFFGNVSGSVLIDGNAITDGGSSAISIHGGDITSDTANSGAFTITNNILTGNVRGIYVAASALASGASVEAHFNDLSGNSEAGAQNKSLTAALDATENWWGCDEGPELGASCSKALENVLFDPWLGKPPYATEVLSGEPVGFWRLGDALDTTAMSDFIESHPGTYVNGAGGSAQLGISGDDNTAAYFVGNGQYGYVNDVEAPQSAYSMEAWVKPSDDGAAMIMQQGGSGALLINEEGKFAFAPDSNNVSLQVVDPVPGDVVPHTGTTGFKQVVGTWDGATGTATLYVNGQPVASATSSKAPSGSATLYIGYGSLAPWFRGYIDEAAYYPTALSAARVLAHFEADPPPLLTPRALVSSPSPEPTPAASPPASGAPTPGAPQVRTPQHRSMGMGTHRHRRHHLRHHRRHRRR